MLPLPPPRGGIRVFDEPEKPDFRFRIPLFPPKNRVNPDFRVFMLDFPPKNRVKPVFRSIRNPVSSKCHYPPHPYFERRIANIPRGKCACFANEMQIPLNAMMNGVENLGVENMFHCVESVKMQEPHDLLMRGN